MRTGFEELDKIINLEIPQLILLTGTCLIEELSGDIANNVCLKQECEVLEIVRCKKEYILQRMFANEANVNYRKWYRKNEYTDEELKIIGQCAVNLIEGTKRLPTIIEQDMSLYDLKKIEKMVLDYANNYGNSERVDTLIILDIFPLSSDSKNLRDRRKSLRLIKNLKNISRKLRCPIIVIDNIDLTKKYNTEDHTCNYLIKEHIDNINKINKYVDTFIIANVNNEKRNICNVDIYNKTDKIGSCKLKYDFNCRKFKNNIEGE